MSSSLARACARPGHTKAAANVIRNVDHKPRQFSTWEPQAIATIRALADTLEDRAVVVRLQRKPPGAKVERLRRRDNAEFAALRSQAARWAADNFDKLADPESEHARPERPRGRQLASAAGDR